MLTGEGAGASVEAALVQAPGETALIATTWAERFLSVGKPLVIGLFVLACSVAPLAYFAVLGSWRLVAASAWRRRQERA